MGYRNWRHVERQDQVGEPGGAVGVSQRLGKQVDPYSSAVFPCNQTNKQEIRGMTHRRKLNSSTTPVTVGKINFWPLKSGFRPLALLVRTR